MTIPDETLMAFTDGELDDSQRKIVEAALRDDPEIRRRVAQHTALRDAVQQAYAAAVDEPVPDRLLNAVRQPVAATGDKVISLSAARTGKATAAQDVDARWRRRTMGSMAATLLLGLSLGYVAWHGSASLLKSTAGGGLLANGDLAGALSNQLSADRPASRVATIGFSFRSKSGVYCRTFVISGRESNSGLACKAGENWEIQVLARSSSATDNESAYRTAASPDSPTILSAVESLIQGEPLDQAAEIAARREGWDQRASR